MALCVKVDTFGYIVNANTVIDQCTDYVLLHSNDYSNMPTLQSIFLIPTQSDLQQMFMTGISLPLIAYLTAWGYGVVINWFNSRNP